MNDKNPIGVFDSGVGGLSIWKELVREMPNENIIYLADSSNAPYGKKTKQEIIDLSVKNTQFLIQNKAKIIVVACNTATTNAIKYLRENYKIPIIGIEPAIKPASLATKTKKIGILATQGTLSSELFQNTSDIYTQNIEVIEKIGEGLVTLVENGLINSKDTKILLKKYLTPMIEKNIDYLVLGCTHYPFLIEIIEDILPKKIKIIDSGESVARHTKNILSKNNLLCNTNQKPKYDIFTNKENTSIIKNILLKYKHLNIQKIHF